MGALSWSHCCSVKAISITYCECVFVALFIPCAKRLLHIFMSSLAYLSVCLSVLYFSTLPQKVTIFGKMFLNAKCLFWLSLQNLSEKFLSPNKFDVFSTVPNKGKGKGRLWVLQHCCLEAYCTLTRMSSFIHLQRRRTHQAAWETSASDGRNYTWNLASNP